MKWRSWAFLAFLGSLAFLVLFIAEQQMNAGVDSLGQPCSPLAGEVGGFAALSFRSLFICGPHPAALRRTSLFLPVIEIGAMLGSACSDRDSGARNCTSF